MDRKSFIKTSLWTSLLAFTGISVSAITNNNDKKIDKKKPKKDGLRGVEMVCSPTNTHMVGNGFKVMNFYPNGKGFEERMSPFFLLDFNAEVNFPPSDIAHGVGVHPHRGIETITFAYKGAVAHHDSAGN